MNFRKKAALTLNNEREAKPVWIVADAAMATVVIGDGRLIPLLILDTTERDDIDNLVRMQADVPPGDVSCQWGDIDYDDGKINLVLTFTRPAEVVVVLEFDVVRQGGLVDQILSAKSVYLQPGRPGDRLATTLDNPRIIA